MWARKPFIIGERISRSNSTLITQVPAELLDTLVCNHNRAKAGKPISEPFFLLLLVEQKLTMTIAMLGPTGETELAVELNFRRSTGALMG